MADFTATIWPGMIYPGPVYESKIIPPDATPQAAQAAPTSPPLQLPLTDDPQPVDWQSAAPQPNATAYEDPTTTEAQRRTYFNIFPPNPGVGFTP